MVMAETTKKNNYKSKKSQKKMKKTAIILLIFFYAVNSSGQRRSGISAYNFNPETYYGANLGFNAYLAEGSNFSNIFRDLGTNQTIFLGYNFSPIIGAKAVVEFGQLGWTNYKNNKIKFGTQSLSGEVLYNLSNQFDIYDLYRKLDISLIGGLGFISRNRSNFNNEYLGYFLKGGVQIDYRLNFYWDIFLSGTINALPDEINETPPGRIPFDLLPTIKIGFTKHGRSNRAGGR